MQDHHRRLQDGFGALVSSAARQWRRPKDLAAALTLDGSSVVRLLDALEASGLIERGEENTDRRAKLISITAQGWSIIEQVEIVARDVRNATLGGLSDDDLRVATRVRDSICRNLARQAGQEE